MIYFKSKYIKALPSKMAEGEVLIDLEENVDLLDYESLKARCGTYGIKRNIKKDEMRWALKQIASGETVPTSYYTQKWLSTPINKQKIVKGGIGLGGLILIGIIGYFLFSNFGGTVGELTNSTNITNTSMFM